MTESMRKHLSGKGGFTLIELMIVIAIIAILAAVAIPQFMSARDKAKVTSTVQGLGAIRKAMEMYLADSDIYDTALADVTINAAGDATTNFDKVVNGIGRYTNVTNLFKAFAKSSTVTIQINSGKGFTMIGIASDRNSSPITATTENIFKP